MAEADHLSKHADDQQVAEHPPPPIDEDVAVDDGPTVIQAHVQLAKTSRMSFFVVFPRSNHILEGRRRAQTVPALSEELDIPHLSDLLARFLFQQLHPNDPRDPSDIPITTCPRYDGRISVFNSAASRFYAPSDLSGTGGMRIEYIRACSSWRHEHARYDCVFVNTDCSLPGMQGLEVARVRALFSFTFRGVGYPCAVIRWFDKVGDTADEDTGMWVVRPGYTTNNTPAYCVIHIDSIYRAAHLIPMYGTRSIPQELSFYHSYDAFRAYYVNKYADHHAFEIAY